MRAQLDDTWPSIQRHLRRRAGEQVYELWLARLEPLRLDDDTLVLQAPPAAARWAARRFARMLDTCAQLELGPAARVRVVPAGSDRSPRPGAAPAHAAATRAGDTPAPTEQHDLNPRHTFAQFVVGTTNHMAHAAALAVAEQPGQAHNPLLVHGPPGTGKTHLLEAIGHYARRFATASRVVYADVERFAGDFVAALRSGGLDDFKRRHRAADLLAIDGVELLDGKPRTTEELLHTVDSLLQSGAQVVVTSDRPLHDLASIDERLLQRLCSGLVCDLQPPDYRTRLMVLRMRVQRDAISAPDQGALELIAERVTGSTRTLEGALIRSVAFASLTNRPLDSELVEDVVARLYPGPQQPRPSIDLVVDVVAEAYALDAHTLLARSRREAVVWPRHVAMHLARELAGSSLTAIGRAFGGRNHATVLNACRQVELRCASDPAFGSDVERVRNVVKTRLADRHC